MPTLDTPYVPDLSVLSMEEIDAYLRPILAAQHEAEDRALRMTAKADAATNTAAREAYRSVARTAASVALSYAVQTEPYMAEWQRRGCPARRTMTRGQFLATPARDLVIFPEGRAPYVVVDRPRGVSQKTYDRHIDSAGKAVITWRLAEDDGRRFEQLLADAQSARAVWVGNDSYNHRWPTRDHRRIYLSARWAD